MNDSIRDAGHDLNNRLSAILAVADVGRTREPAGSRSGRAFADISDAAKRAAASATEIGAFGRDLRYLRGMMPTGDPLLRELEVLCEREGIPAVSPDTGRLLGVMAAAVGAKRILELGTAFGYSALCMTMALPADARIATVDPDRARAAVARGFFERAGVAARIEQIDGKALEVLPLLAGRSFDFVFIDALKEEYTLYLEGSLPLLEEGGLVMVDNLLWSHRASAPPAGADEASTTSIRRFNKTFVSHPALLATILPVGDGVGIGVKR